jgi:fatty acid desaturase
LPPAAYVVAWHGSLQHETIHALARVPKPARRALAAPPLAIWLPYAVYVRDHRRHHGARNLTDPAFDPESYYHDETDWRGYAPLYRALVVANQTLLGRMLLGPAIAFMRVARDEFAAWRGGDASIAPIWATHLVTVALLLALVDRVAHVTWWEYLVLFAYPGASLASVRSFLEHRTAENADHRTVLVESRLPLALLFLNNNLHLVHHLHPSLPWYRIPRVWNAERDTLLERNGGFFFRGYAEIARRWLVRPAFVPVATDAGRASGARRKNHASGIANATISAATTNVSP